VLFENRASINLTCVLRKTASARDFLARGRGVSEGHGQFL
jgi:hypothetical protein